MTKYPILHKPAGPSSLGEVEKEELAKVTKDPLLHKLGGPSLLSKLEKEEEERITRGTDTQS